MNYHSLSRRDLQALCKEHKLPANKSNVAMADSLTALLSSSSHIPSPPAAAPAQVAPPTSTAKKSRAKVEKVETSLAALILSPYNARPSSCNALTARSTREIWALKALNAEAFAAPPSTSKKGGIPLPKSTPIRRKAKPTEVCTPTCDDNKSCKEVQGLSNDISPSLQGITLSVGTVVKDEAPLGPAPHDVAIVRENQDMSKMNICLQGVARPGLSPLFRIRSNVDAAIDRATSMLERFEQWKSMSIDGSVQSFSTQMQLYEASEQQLSRQAAMDKENHVQSSPCKNIRSQNMPSNLAGKGTELDRKDAVLRDRAPNTPSTQAPR